MGSRGVLSDRQKQILIGTLLGDAHLEINGRNARLRIDHRDLHKDYVFWMFREFAPFSLKPREIIQRDKRNGRIYKRWHFSTKSLAVFTEVKNTFYRGNAKIVPLNIADLLTELSIAIWYMDDGYKRKDSKGFFLCTSSFTSNEQVILQDALFYKFGIKTNIHHQNGLERLFVPSNYSEKFNDLVKQNIHSVFRYKLL